jgi:transposase
MEMALENLSKQELIALLEHQQTSISSRDKKINSLSQERDYLKSQVEM